MYFKVIGIFMHYLCDVTKTI